MFQIDLKSRKAIYAQIIDSFKRLIITGTLQPDEKVPSIRELAQAITVNPNTVQKAYRELESTGYFYTVLGQGSFIAAVPESETPPPEVDALYTQLTSIIQELIFRGQTPEAISRAVDAQLMPIPKDEKSTGAQENHQVRHSDVKGGNHGTNQ